MTLDATTVAQLVNRRTGPTLALADQSRRVAEACHAVAERFQRGGTLFVLGRGTGATDAAHVAVEFVHPVVMGKRALPALALAHDMASPGAAVAGAGPGAGFAHQLATLAGPGDIALGLSSGDGESDGVVEGLTAARRLGLLTLALTGRRSAGDSVADWVFSVDDDDPRIVKETHVSMYHLLWELVHVTFEHPALVS